MFTSLWRKTEEYKPATADLMVTHDDFAHCVTRTVAITDGAILADQLSATGGGTDPQARPVVTPMPLPTTIPLLSLRLEPLYA